MQQWIDCTILCTHTTREWAQRWVQKMTDNKLRILLHDIADGPNVTVMASDTAVLAEAHVCLLPVCNANLSWARTWLNQASKVLSTPVLAVTCELKSIALHDLFSCGAADFLPGQGCREELRTRVERVLAHARTAQLDRISQSLGTTPSNGSYNTKRRTHTYIMGRRVSHTQVGVAELRQGHEPEAPGSQHQDAFLRHHLLINDAIEPGVFADAMATHCALYGTSFKQAKDSVVDRFEKTYLSVVLSRYCGNITQAAKAAKKHRRAFWQLVCKHDIDIAQYRGNRKKRE